MNSLISIVVNTISLRVDLRERPYTEVTYFQKALKTTVF